MGSKKNLKKLPEQENMVLKPTNISDYSVLIKRLPCFWGIITEKGNLVKMPFNHTKGYEDYMSLKAYLIGMFYAEQIKCEINVTYYPKKLEDELKSDIFTFIQESEEAYLEELKSKDCRFIPPSKEDNKKLFNFNNIYRNQTECLKRIFLGFSPYSVSMRRFITELQEKHENYYRMISPIKSMNDRFPNLEGLTDEEDY